jgi:protein-L-isoaspartate(D-aspartate) O-methyltransferase
MNPKEEMIENQLKQRDIHDEKVLEAMYAIDRSIFVPEHLKEMAWDDTALPLGGGQTISQPYIVAYMAQILDLQPDDTILEVGTGCGYNAAVLSRLAAHVYSVEIIHWLAKLAEENLDKIGINNVSIRNGDGFQGWTEKEPFDKIMLTASAPEIPVPLKLQLMKGGKILAPVADTFQKLVLLEKIDDDEYKEHELIHVRFVPMTGEARGERRWKGIP